MKLNLELSPELKNKFQDQLAKELGESVWGASIEDNGKQYVFSFRTNGSGWTIQLDKNCHNGAWYKLYCSTRELDLPINCIKDLKIFCKQVVRIRQMQNDFLASKYK